MVTGASGGIGFEFAKLLAADGYRLLLVGQNAKKLQKAADGLRADYPVEVLTATANLSKQGAAEQVMKKFGLAAAEVDILINNAGFGLSGLFAVTDLKRERDMVGVNINALTELTKLVLPGMTARGSGRIMNVASIAAFSPGPAMAVYYATKAFVLSFSGALREECAGSGITVSVLCPGPTRTNFEAAANGKGSRLFSGKSVMSAARVARVGYRGLQQGKAIIVPGWRNKLFATLSRVLPRRAMARVAFRSNLPYR